MAGEGRGTAGAVGARWVRWCGTAGDTMMRRNLREWRIGRSSRCMCGCLPISLGGQVSRMRISKTAVVSYPFAIRPLGEEEGGGFLIEYPDLPG